MTTTITGYTLKEEKSRISAVCDDGTEIVGARIPRGELHWKLYLTDRLTEEVTRCHPVVCSRDGARQWVLIVASLYTAAQMGQAA